MAKEDEETKKRFELSEVPTQTAFFVKDNETEEVWDDKRALVEILNGIEALKKAVV